MVCEVAAGIILGPSALTRDETFANKIFYKESIPNLSLIANIGLILYLFIVGMELDPKIMVKSGGGLKAIWISIWGIAIPFGLGCAISKTMFDTLQGDDPDFKDTDMKAFYVFMGTAMCITAFPVLARILKDGGLIYTRAGAIAMSAAAVDDAMAWVLLVLSISLANASDTTVAGYVFLSVAAFGIGLIVILRKPWHRFIRYVESFQSKFWDNYLFVFTLCILFMCSWTTNVLGVHFIFGAFIFGVTIPKKSRLFHTCMESIENIVVSMFLPMYFTLSGLKTDIRNIHGGKQGAMIILVCFVATVGKVVGCGSASLLSGIPEREAAVVAILMNTRGLVELIVLNLGLEYHILSPRTFAVMVIMALFTTWLTCPIVAFIYPPHLRVSVDAILTENKNEEATEASVIAVPSVSFSNETFKELRLGVTIGELSEMLPLMNVLSVLTHRSVLTTDKLTAIRVLAPTNSDRDRFLGPSRQLILEDDVAATSLGTKRGNDTADGTILPLTMFCSCNGISFRALRLRGDPSEFPLELRSITEVDGCNFMLVPWDGTEFSQRIVWGCVRLIGAPVGVIADLRNHVRVEAEDQTAVGAAPTSGPDAIEMVTRTIRRMTVGGQDDAGSAAFRSVFATDDVESSILDRPNIRPINVNSIAVLLSGRAADMAILSLLFRMAGRPDITLTVVQANGDKFTQEATDLYQEVKSLCADRPQVQFIELEGEVSEATLVASLMNTQADLVVASFWSPVTKVASPATSGRSRSNSITSSFNTTPDIETLRRQTGVPESLVDSSVEFLEIGTIGTRLRNAGYKGFVVIIHEYGSQGVVKTGQNAQESAVPVDDNNNQV